MTKAYVLGKGSRAELKGVHPSLVAVVERAIQITKQDFSVHDGKRTLAEQKEYVRRGASKTMRSRHLEQKDKLGYAVDLVPWINGKLRWEWGEGKGPFPIFEIALAMAKAAKELGVHLTWGAIWDRKMHEYESGTVAGLRRSVEAYKKRHKGSDFLDGPHFELPLPKK